MKKFITTLIILAIIVVGAVLIFNNSNENNSVENNNETPSPGATTTVSVFFGNSEMSDGTDCSEVFAVDRIVEEVEAVGTAALEELIAGPSTEERENGYFTSLPEGVSLNSLNIEDGTAYVDFNEALNEGGGSCTMSARSAEIMETLKQFSTVDNVVISVNGETETVLQP